MLRRPRIEVGWASLCGSNHDRNQDAVSVAAPLFAVADGVGGGRAGELASGGMLAWCRAVPHSVWQDPTALAALLPQADEALAATLRPLNLGGPSATTFVAVWLRRSGYGHVTHVGDTRLLLGRASSDESRTWQQVTQDDTYALVGETPPLGSSANDPARMVGVGAMGQPEVQALRLRENDMLLLCSDGLHRFVDVTTVDQTLVQAEQMGLRLNSAAQILVEAARAGGSTDDASIVLVRLNPWRGARLGFWFAAAGTIGLAAVLRMMLVGLSF